MLNKIILGLTAVYNSAPSVPTTTDDLSAFNMDLIDIDIYLAIFGAVAGLLFLSLADTHQSKHYAKLLLGFSILLGFLGCILRCIG